MPLSVYELVNTLEMMLQSAARRRKNDGIVARRSVLGKEFSANVFNELYPAPKNDKQVPEQHTAP